MNYLMAFRERNHVWFYGLMRKRKGLIRAIRKKEKRDINGVRMLHEQYW